jgi:N utilization substance protein B
LQVLFQDDLNPGGNPHTADEFLRQRLSAVASQAEDLIGLARSLVSGVRRNRVELDAMLERTADNWRVERMAATDRNILRLGAYEILYADTPDPVVINEAVELAKRYGTAQSAQFVNGILDKFVEGHQK